MPSGCTCIGYVQDTRQLYIGQENGTITQYILSEDCNRLSFVRDYLAHQARIVNVVFSQAHNWILSCSKDKTVGYHCAETARRIGVYNFETSCTALQFDSLAKYAFVGDHAGQITMLKCDLQGVQLITTFKGHTASVRCLKWVEGPQLLFSGSCDLSVIVWDSYRSDITLPDLPQYIQVRQTSTKSRTDSDSKKEARLKGISPILEPILREVYLVVAKIYNAKLNVAKVKILKSLL
ncbi:hypothetical protein GQX74_009608 [Glossina fuscipes]|nr:hypothetical protein GQX74_009608 [Glossina fuscipes]